MAGLLGRIIQGQFNDIEQIKNGLLQDMQKFGTNVTQAAQKLVDSKAGLDAKVLEHAETSRTLEVSKNKVNQLIKDYEDRINSISAVQTTLESVIEKLNAAQQNATTREQLVADLQKTIEVANDKHDETQQTLREQYNAARIKLEGEKEDAKKELEKTQNNLKASQTELDLLKNKANNIASLTETVAVSSAKIAEREAAETRHGVQQRLLKDAHLAEIQRLREKHERELKSAAAETQEARLATEKLRKEKEVTTRQMEAAKTEATTVKEEMVARRRELTDITTSLWNVVKLEVTEKAFPRIRGEIERALSSHARKLTATEEVTAKLINKISAWDDQFRELQDTMQSDLNISRQDHLELATEAKTSLESALTEAEEIIERGAHDTKLLALSQKHHKTALDAVHAQKEAIQYRKEIDDMMYEIQEAKFELGTMNRALETTKEEDDKIISKLQEKEKNYQAEVATLRDFQTQLESITSSTGNTSQGIIDSLNKQLSDTRRELREAEKSKTAAQIHEKDLRLEEGKNKALTERLDATLQKLEECRTDKTVATTRDLVEVEKMEKELAELRKTLDDYIISNATNEYRANQIEGLQQRLDQCNQHKAINEDKAQAYDEMGLAVYVTKVEKLEDNMRKFQQQTDQLTRSNRELQDNNDKLKKDLEDCLAKHRADSPTPVVQTRKSTRQAEQRQASTATQKTTGGTLGRRTLQRGLNSVRNVFGRPTTPDPGLSPGSIDAPDNVSSAVSSNVASRTTSRPSSAFGIGPEPTIQPGSTTGGLAPPFEASSSDLRRAPPTSTVTASESTTSLGKHGRQTGDTPEPQVRRRTEGGAVPRETTLTLPRSRPLPSSNVPETPTVEDTDMYGAPQTRRDPATTSAGAEEGQITARDFAAAESSQPGRDDSEVVSGGDDRPTDVAQDNVPGQAETGETAEQATALEQARRVGTAPPRRYPGETVWQGPPVGDPQNPSQASVLYNAVHLPPNWDQQANDYLNSVLTSNRLFTTTVNDFHNNPPCLNARVARRPPKLNENQTTPCAFCKTDKKGSPCFGLTTLDDTIGPTSRSDGTAPRMDFERNSDGYYWKAFYRPARGPDPDNGGDGNGGQGSSTGGMAA